MEEPSPALRGRPSRKREGDILGEPLHRRGYYLHEKSHPPSGRVERQRGEGERNYLRVARKTRGHNRGGYVLVLFVLLLFGIFAMAALVIDIGFARLAQRQMQTAADAAALEGIARQR